ncbi:hypothetical protein CLV24_1126 [Pontibacter ummariensis]|uniref:Uncharacterized protein n=1 Tax=Pontibacter ummariensis TaxID=1610492 RepID=A0A239H508_9BACT|nr:hypothetical protein [Pontibacter ummariensis]PRY10879.1 hypothetical protein CLV24_1126 [Pontibacter ummariensis]SNS76460.1 hypothetical protein SAMN06296052_112172 [Pontibacter ummariensis]
MNNIRIKPGQMLLGTVMSWLVVSFLAYATADFRGETNILYTLLQITFYFSILLSAEAYISMLFSPEWARIHIGTILLLCAPALLYLVWFLSETLF